MSRPELDDRPRTGQLRVLLVEDDAGDAFLAQEYLAPMETQVTWVGSLREALDRMPVDRPDCVLLDLDLPDTVSLDGLHRLQAVSHTAAVVVLTGDNDEHRGMAAVAAGAQDYLVKNHIDSPLLTKALRYAVERKRAQTSAQQWRLAQVREEENSRLERGLLPVPLLRRSSLQVHSRYQPGREQAQLGGDFYDVVEDVDGRVWLLIGDVSGHGPDEAALGVALRVGWRALVLAGLPAQSVLGRLQQLLVAERQHDELFATVGMAVVDPDIGVAELFLAGHPAPLLVGPEGTAPVPATGGLPLGILDDTTWLGETVRLPDGWTLLWFTDGLIEGFDGAPPSRLGVGALTAIVGRLASGRGGIDGELLDAVIEEVVERNGAPLTDDVAVVALRQPA